LIDIEKLASNLGQRKHDFFTAKCTDSVSSALMIRRPFIHAPIDSGRS
jgi:hypothetical protein